MAVRLQVHSLADNFGQERHIHLGQSCHLATNELQHFLPAIVFAKTLPHGGNDTACSSPSRSFEIVLLAKTIYIYICIYIYINAYTYICIKSAGLPRIMIDAVAGQRFSGKAGIWKEDALRS